MKNLELNWIRKFDKTLVMPEVMFYPMDGCSGRYYYPRKDKEIFDEDGRGYWMRYGVIAINPEVNCDYAGTIAHEWRHHWQCFNGIPFELSKRPDECEDYNEGLRRYFTSSKTELDAVRFEHKHAGVWEEWEEPLYDLLIGLRPKPIITYGNNTTTKN